MTGSEVRAGVNELAPAARQMLEEMWNSGRPQSNELPVAEARANLDAVFAGLAPGSAVGRVQDMALGENGPAARIYSNGDRAPAAIVYLHGGGWTLGGVNIVDVPCRELAIATGCVVVNIEYRLAPEHPFPAAVEDVERAVRWLSGNRDALSVDSDRLVLAGESAGANLAAVAVNELSSSYPIDVQVLACPVVSAGSDPSLLDLRYDEFFLSQAELQQFDRNYIQSGTDPHDPRVSPLHGPLPDTRVATLVIAAQCDPLRPHAEAYARKLRAAGRTVDLDVCEGMVHGFFGLPELFGEARDALARVGGFVHEHLGYPATIPPGMQ